MEGNLPKFENTDNLTINKDNVSDLRKAMCWAKFMSIVSFVLTGMMLVLSLVMLFGGSMCPMMNYELCGGVGLISGITSLISTAIYFFYAYFMYMFSTKIKKAIAENNQTYLNQGIVNMKNYFMLTGIMMVVALAIILITLLFSGVMVAALM